MKKTANLLRLFLVLNLLCLGVLTAYSQASNIQHQTTAPKTFSFEEAKGFHPPKPDEIENPAPKKSEFDPSLLTPVHNSASRFDWRLATDFLTVVVLFIIFIFISYWLIYRVKWETDGHDQSDLGNVIGMKEAIDELIPIHPGEILREEYMKPLGFTGDILARILEVPSVSINKIISGKRGITADTALRLASYFNTTPELWTGLQADYDLRMARIAPRRRSILETVSGYSVMVVKLTAAVLLFAALGRDTNDYYIILRCVACGICAYTAFQAAQIQKFGWLFVFGIFAIVLNPIAPLHLKRASWTFVDIAAAVLLLLSIVIMDFRRPRT